MTTTPTIWKGLTYSGDGIVPAELDQSLPVSERYDSMVSLPGGGFILFWSDYKSMQGQVYDAEGHRQGAVFDPFTYTNANLQTFSRSILLKDGTTVIAFDSTQDSDTDFRLMGFNPDGTLKFDSFLETNSAYWTGKNSLQLSALADGGYVATWHAQFTDGGTFDFTAVKRFDADGNAQSLTGTPTIWDNGDGTTDNDTNTELERLDEIRSFTQLNTTSQETVIGLTGGGFVVLWEDFSDNVFARFFGSDGVPKSPPDYQIQPDGPVDVNDATASVYALDGAALTNGNIAIAWTEFAGGLDSDLRIAVYDKNGVEVLSDTNLTDNPGTDIIRAGDAYNISIIALSGGGFALAWVEDLLPNVGYGTYAVKWQSFNADGTPDSAAVTFSAFTGSSPQLTSPNMIELADGTILMAWYDSKMTDSPYAAVRLDPDGNQIGEVFVAIDAASDSSSPESPDLQLLADGRVLVAIDDNTFTTPFTILDPRDSIINGDNQDNIITSRQDGARVNGLGGDDQLLGQNAKDQLFGGNGADDLLGRDGDDTLSGGGGKDKADGGGGADTINGGDGDDILDGRAGSDTISGNAGKDTLRGQAGNDRLIGGGAADRLFGNAGADTLNGGGQNDRLLGQAGADKLNGQAGADLLDGGNGKDKLAGGGGADILKGGGGNDRLAGNRGNDTLTGGKGADRYVFAKHDGKDKITGFGGKDKLDLTAFNYATKADALLDFYEIGGANNDVMGFSANGTEIRIIGSDLNDFTKADIII